jgi:Na+/H+ antiporter NhaD/arsenite permease-like protein
MRRWLGLYRLPGDSPQLLYVEIGPTFANTIIGVASAVLDNVPIMAAVIQIEPNMSDEQWLLITLTAGAGGSMLSSAAGVALMGQAWRHCTFFSHLRWTPTIALGYAASIVVHLWINSRLSSTIGQ